MYTIQIKFKRKRVEEVVDILSKLGYNFRDRFLATARIFSQPLLANDSLYFTLILDDGGEKRLSWSAMKHASYQVVNWKAFKTMYDMGMLK